MNLPSPKLFPITPTLFEVSDGILIIMLGIMLLFAFVHLFAIWNDCRKRYPGNWGAFRCIRGIYFERKPAVAITVIVGALWLRFTNLWHLRHLANHGLTFDWIAEHSFSIFLISYITLIWGVICWIRNISPFRVLNWEWVLILTAATALSFWWAEYLSF